MVLLQVQPELLYTILMMIIAALSYIAFFFFTNFVKNIEKKNEAIVLDNKNTIKQVMDENKTTTENLTTAIDKLRDMIDGLKDYFFQQRSRDHEEFIELKKDFESLRDEHEEIKDKCVAVHRTRKK